jgi:hypothetical protein
MKRPHRVFLEEPYIYSYGNQGLDELFNTLKHQVLERARLRWRRWREDEEHRSQRRRDALRASEKHSRQLTRKEIHVRKEHVEAFQDQAGLLLTMSTDGNTSKPVLTRL